MTHENANVTPDKDRVGKGHLVTRVAEKTGLSPKESHAAVTAIFETLREELAAGRRVSIQHFGAFLTRVQKETNRRNPHTGDTFVSPERLAPKFVPATELKQHLNGSTK